MSGAYALLDTAGFMAAMLGAFWFGYGPPASFDRRFGFVMTCIGAMIFLFVLINTLDQGASG